MDNQFEKVEEQTNIIVKKLLNQEMWINYGFIALKIVLILIFSAIIIRVGKSAIGNILKVKPKKSPLKFTERREATLVRLLQNILTYVVYFIAAITILSTVGIDITGLLAGAGILGLAVGFGAQSLVKDVISGFFIIFEDQFSVGDEVKIGTFEGNVREIGLRTTKVLSWTGELYVIPNGSILNVTNLSVYNSTAVVDIDMTYSGDLEKVENAIESLLVTLPEKYNDIIGTPKLLGIQKFGGSEVVFRVTAETAPLKHWTIERQLRRELMLELEAQESNKSEVENMLDHQEE